MVGKTVKETHNAFETNNAQTHFLCNCSRSHICKRLHLKSNIKNFPLGFILYICDDRTKSIKITMD